MNILWLLCSNYRSDQLSDTKDLVTEVDKCVEPDHCSGGNDPDTVDKKQLSDSSQTRVC
jgi:hypothetical protein